MTDDFTTFQEALLTLVKSFEKKNVLIKLYSDTDSNIIRIYGERSEGLAVAKIGLEEIEELAFTTAEHHPYWSFLYNSSQIIKIVLERWNEKLSKDEIKEIIWLSDEIKNSSDKATFQGHDE